MNNNILLAENPNFKFVIVKFQSSSHSEGFSGKTYTYKTLLDVKVGDMLMVNVNGRYKAVVCILVVPPYDVDLSAYNYNWIVSLVDTTSYTDSLELEKQVNQKVNALSFATKRRALNKELQQVVGEAGIKSLRKLIKG